MKKKVLLFVIIVFAAIAAAFAFAGCGGGKENTPSGSREYAVFDDGCGKKYTMYGGENLTVYYEYDAEKVLNFTTNYYKDATGEKILNGGVKELPCNNPTVYTFQASPLNDEANAEECFLTVIISGQPISEFLSENGQPVRADVYKNAGAVFSFVPEMTGNYTVSCDCVNEGEEVEVTVINVLDEIVPSGGIFHKGWKYYVHVKAKTASDNTSVSVWTSVAFTPTEVKAGENQVTLSEYSSTLEFTPEDDGVYTTATDADCGFRFLDGETYEIVNLNTYGEDAILLAGKKYFIQCTVGYRTERQANLIVKRTDRVFAADTVNDLSWSESYVFTADKTSNYNFNVTENYGYGATQFNVYEYNGWLKYGKTFIDNGEFNLVLEVGKYVISVSHDCKAKGTYAPKTLSVGKSVYAKSREVLTFTPSLNCVYDFSAWDGENAKFTVIDKDGTVVNGERFIEGEAYEVVPSFGNADKNYWVDVEPVPDGEMILNRAIQPKDGCVYGFTPSYEGIYGYERYKFVGASELEIYDEECNAVDTYGDNVYLISGNKYYAMIYTDKSGDSVKIIYYPDAIPVDTNVKIVGTRYKRIELTQGCEVSILINHINEGTCAFLDADLKQIKSFELTKDEKLSTLTHTFEEAGIYYLFIEHYGSLPTVSFAVRPVGCAGDFVAESGNAYKIDNNAVCRFDSDFLNGKFTVTVWEDVRAENILDCVKVYHEDGNGDKRYLKLQKLSGDYHSTVFTFYPVEGVETYFIEIAGGLQFRIN